MYNDNYPTCASTYATFQIYYDNIHPDKLTDYLEIKPTDIQIKGHKNKLRKNKLVNINGWFLCSKNIVDSKDCRRHIDYLIDNIYPLKLKIETLIKDGAKINISCFWESQSGHGGPILSSQQFIKLGELEIDLWFDFYC